MAPPFDKKVVLITGASSGIGEAAAELFSQAGAMVFGTARNDRALESARSRHPRVRWLLADVTHSSVVNTAIDAVAREGGRIDVVVNNAAIFAFGSLEQSSDEMIRGHFEANVYGTAFVTRAALPALKQSRGCVVNISSAAGHLPDPGGSIYGATKAAVESLTRSWALELAPFGVRVNAIAPGPTETPGFEKMGIPPEEVAAMKAAFLRKVPLGRMASAEEVARWIVTLADPSATWVTGQVLSVDGGMSLT